MFEPVSVTSITTQIKNVVEGSLLLQEVAVEGEVSNCRPASSGHWYFTLKDAGSQLKCVMWRGTAAQQSVLPEDGASLIAFGDITVYTQRGEYQLQVSALQAVGVGDLYAQLARLTETLKAEGLFESERKKPLPELAFRIGIVTSPEAAALQDVLNVLRRRHPLAEVILSPALVQGVEAPPQLVRAIEALDRSGQADVIMLVRGGGSIEDLWAFNDERVVRAVAACSTPTITGVGHETDTTLVDWASDERAPTPSAAAEIITANAALLPQIVARLFEDLDERMLGMLDIHRVALDDHVRRLDFMSPQRQIDSHRQTVDALEERLRSRIELRLNVARERTISQAHALEAANPAGLLARGYAVVRNRNGAPVRSVGQVNAGERLTVQVQDGVFDVRVEKGEDRDGQPRLAGF
jgi:exodeoxyribonuclease VII large subunit